MTEIRYDVVGIGNAIVDIIGRCEDDFLAQRSLNKGGMQLVDADAVAALYDAMGPAVEISGGSAANTIVGVASFGGKSAFIGKVADDEFGHIFAHLNHVFPHSHGTHDFNLVFADRLRVFDLDHGIGRLGEFATCMNHGSLTLADIMGRRSTHRHFTDHPQEGR